MRGVRLVRPWRKLGSEAALANPGTGRVRLYDPSGLVSVGCVRCGAAAPVKDTRSGFPIPELAKVFDAADDLTIQPGAQAKGNSVDELEVRIKDALDKHRDSLGEYAKTGELDFESFMTVMRLIVPDMEKEETRALFMSMDTSNDGNIQAPEIFSPITMAILKNRMGSKVDHPLEGSYHCLPSPPFFPDPRQLMAIDILKTVFDEVIIAHAKPVPTPPPRIAPQAAKKASEGFFSSIFGGVRKTKPQTPTPKLTEAPPPAPNAPKGAYLYGGCGCGKTVLLDLFFRSLPEGFTARRLHWHEFIRDAFRSMQGQPPGANIFEAMAEMLSKQFRVLLLDELLITHISEAILVKNLFRHMWARGMTIITTSNYLPDELYAKGFNRDQFIDFIPELAAQCPVINMKGETDYRKLDVQVNSNLFFHPLDGDSLARFDRAFASVVGEKIDLDTELPVPKEKRHIRVPARGLDARGAKVARFSFADLCENSRGRADYSVIAENFHTIFLEGVPKFHPDKGAEFRRFVSLTDILYGKKVALYLQSEAHTDVLFEDGMKSPDMDLDELWAFRRCSSMLSEMQNPKYHHMVWLMRNHMLQESALHL